MLFAVFGGSRWCLCWPFLLYRICSIEDRSRVSVFPVGLFVLDLQLAHSLNTFFTS